MSALKSTSIQTIYTKVDNIRKLLFLFKSPSMLGNRNRRVATVLVACAAVCESETRLYDLQWVDGRTVCALSSQFSCFLHHQACRSMLTLCVVFARHLVGSVQVIPGCFQDLGGAQCNKSNRPLAHCINDYGVDKRSCILTGVRLSKLFLSFICQHHDRSSTSASTSKSMSISKAFRGVPGAHTCTICC
jgi:hypothetical protein